MIRYEISSEGRVVRRPDGVWIAAEVVDGNLRFLDEDSDHIRDLKAWLAAGNSLAPYAPTKDEQNAPILRELEANDRKAVRAIVEGNGERIAAHNARQAELRAMLRN